MRQRITVEIPRARAFMNTHVLTFSPTQSIGDAVEVLSRKGFSGAPVVDDNGRLVGILSEADCIRVLSHAAFEGWPAGTVADHMTREMDAIPPTADVFDVAGRFADGTHRRFPVTDDDGRLLGLVTRRDLMRALDGFRNVQTHARRATTYELIARRRSELN